MTFVRAAATDVTVTNVNHVENVRPTDIHVLRKGQEREVEYCLLKSSNL